MASNPCGSLLAAFGRLTDPRHRRGVRHPSSGLLGRAAGVNGSRRPAGPR